MVSGIVYVAAQQMMRANANDPQVQIAHDISNAIAQGRGPREFFPPSGQPDINGTLAPFAALFDEKGALIGASGTLDGKPLSVPVGVLDRARESGENRVTWQPRPGVRMALVAVPFQGAAQGTSTQSGPTGVAIAGRSLQEVEYRVSSILGPVVAVGWFASIVAVSVVAMLL